ncbi:MAG: hypothetical protein JO166_21955 [Deltaproteobacteria bacterium]|nr:hypothetical protein [Deltaproteobacteria bacterium]
MKPHPILRTLLLTSGFLCGISYGASADLLSSGFTSVTQSPVVGPDPIFDFAFSIGADTGVGSLNTVDIGGGAFAAVGGSLTVTGGLDIGSYVLFPGGPGVTISPSGAFAFDDVLYPVSDPYLDVWGLLFTGGGLEVNVWGNAAGNYSFYSYNNSSYNVADTAVAPFSAIPVSEPATLWVFGAGLLGLGLLPRVTRRWIALRTWIRAAFRPLHHA